MPSASRAAPDAIIAPVKEILAPALHHIRIPGAARAAPASVIALVEEILAPVLRPNRMAGAARAALAPIIAAVKETLALGSGNDLEMVPVSGLGDEIEEEMPVCAVVGTRSLPTANGTSGATTLLGRKEGMRSNIEVMVATFYRVLYRWRRAR